MTDKEKVHILIVEDNDVNATVLTHFLMPYNHPIHRVVNGQEAVDHILSNPVQLIMMDINMPIMDGHEATVAIRKLTHIEQPTIIAVTADSTTGSAKACIKSGMNRFLAKPINAKQLSDTVDQYLK